MRYLALLTIAAGLASALSPRAEKAKNTTDGVSSATTTSASVASAASDASAAADASAATESVTSSAEVTSTSTAAAATGTSSASADVSGLNPIIDPNSIIDLSSDTTISDILSLADPAAQLSGLSLEILGIMNQLGLGGILSAADIESLGFNANLALLFRMQMIGNLLQLGAISNGVALQLLQDGIVFGSQFNVISALTNAGLGGRFRGNGLFGRRSTDLTPDALGRRAEMRKLARKQRLAA